MNLAARMVSARGVTLIEILTVIAIVSLVVATTGPSFVRAVTNARFNAAAREVLNALRTARYEARQGRQETIVTFDTSRRVYVIDGHAHALELAPDARLSLITADSELVDAGTAAIRFFPDGSSTGGEVSLASENRSVSIAVDWLTGQVALASAGP